MHRMVHLMLDEYLGRGIPKLTDSEMAQQARGRYSQGGCAPTHPPPHRGLGGVGGACHPTRCSGKDWRVWVWAMACLTPPVRSAAHRSRVRPRVPCSRPFNEFRKNASSESSQRREVTPRSEIVNPGTRVGAFDKSGSRPRA